jgi:hypothetical protein
MAGRLKLSCKQRLGAFLVCVHSQIIGTKTENEKRASEQYFTRQTRIHHCHGLGGVYDRREMAFLRQGFPPKTGFKPYVYLSFRRFEYDSDNISYYQWSPKLILNAVLGLTFSRSSGYIRSSKHPL